MEVAPLIYPQCGCQMPACALHADRKIISFIKVHKLIDRLINRCKLTFKAECPPPAQTQLAVTAVHLLIFRFDLADSLSYFRLPQEMHHIIMLPIFFAGIEQAILSKKNPDIFFV